jgi:hypothetical protein
MKSTVLGWGYRKTTRSMDTMKKLRNVQMIIIVEMIIIVVYVDDIIFGSNDDEMRQKFAEEMQEEFEMSMLGELSLFLELQITQTSKHIHLSDQIHQRDVEEV